MKQKYAPLGCIWLAYQGIDFLIQAIIDWIDFIQNLFSR